MGGAASTRKVQDHLDSSPLGFQTLACLLKRIHEKDILLIPWWCFTWGRWSTLLPLVGHVLVHQVAVVLNHMLQMVQRESMLAEEALHLSSHSEERTLFIEVLNINSYLEVRIGGEVALHPLVALVLGRRLGLQSLKVSNLIVILEL